MVNERGVTTDSTGRFQVSKLAPGYYNVTVLQIGYTTLIKYIIVLTSANESEVSFELKKTVNNLTGVIVSSKKNTAKATSLETPLSVQRLTVEEIKSNHGGNFDISKVIQTLAGVGGGVSGFRFGIIIRGGGPGENVYYIDGIEIPVINHFGTQGSGDGPQGILNVSFIEDVKLSSSAFDTRYDNALSSVLQFKQKTGNPNRIQGNVRLSATELATTFEGKLSKKTTFLASARRSYLQFLFQAIDLPIRPNYWDFQFKTTTKIDNKTILTFLGVGAIDEFSFAAPKTATPEKLYVINSNPIINQWNYTFGATLKRLTNKGFWNLALSRNAFDNELDKYEDNKTQLEAQRILRATSRETENKFRFDMSTFANGWKISYGAMLQKVQFKNNFFNVYRKQLNDSAGNVVQPQVIINSVSDIGFVKYGAFAQMSKRFFDDRVSLSAGLRMDANSLTNSENNPLKQLAPRISASFAVANKWTINASVGRYYKLPPYTVLGYTNLLASSVNLQKNQGDYIASNHFVAGVEYQPSQATRFTVEGFIKKYSNYPVSVLQGVSLANQGSDFSAIGNEAVTPTGKGKAYGIEFFAQQKLTKRFFGILSYTYYRSKFTNAAGTYLPAAWDNQHLLSITWGYKFKYNWELGLKFRYQGGAPYTPFDEDASRKNYLSQGTGILNNNLFNTQRFPGFNASDVRIDKKWNFKKFTLDIFINLQNWYLAKSIDYPQFKFKGNENNTAFITTDNRPIKVEGSNAIPLLLNSNDHQVTPTFGFIIEF
jgi:outer membrane receptor for ferrienterochelin and colicin